MANRCFLLIAFMLALAVPATASAGFVQRSGTNLTLDGKSFRFVGHNNYQLTSIAGQYICGRALDDATLDRLLRKPRPPVRASSGRGSSRATTAGPATRTRPFDRVLTRAAASGLKVVPVLVNHYPDCEPSGGQRKDEGFYDYGYKHAGWGYPRSYQATTRALSRRSTAPTRRSPSGRSPTKPRRHGPAAARPRSRPTATSARRTSCGASPTTWARRSRRPIQTISCRSARSAPASAGRRARSTSTSMDRPASTCASSMTTTTRRSPCPATRGTGSPCAWRSATHSASRC